MLSRREFAILLKNIAGSSALYPIVSNPLLAESTDDHFFIFVELKGGVHNLISTDFPDRQQLKTIIDKYPGVVMEFMPNDGPGFMSENISEEYKELLKNKDSDAYLDNGYFATLPANLTTGEGFINGMTTSNRPYRLGIAGLPLADQVNAMSVLRGVFMLGNAHSLANNELYSGHTIRGDHVAIVLAKLLAQRHGIKPLDNLMIDSAVYLQDKGQPPKAVSSKALLSLLTNADDSFPLANPKMIAQSLAKYVGRHEQGVFDSYVKAFGEAEQILAQNTSFSQESSQEMRFDLKRQLDLCLSLIQNNLSRVLTVRMGGTSGFGYFDTHSGLYHLIEGGFSNNPDESYPHHRNLARTMSGIANFIAKLKATPYQGNKKMFDVVTVVISSEFGRPNNFGGNAVGGTEGDYPLGNGHSYFNNNYILFGKNVAQGMWLGDSDPITHFPHLVNFDELNRGNFAKSFSDPVAETSKRPGQKVQLKPGIIGSSILQDEGENMERKSAISVPRRADNSKQRAFMAKDVVRTLMAIAGVEDEFSDYYSDDFYRDAQVIKALLSS